MTKQIFKFLWDKSKKYKWIITQLFLYTLIIQSISLVSPYITGLLLDSFISGFDFQKSLKLILIGLGLTLISRIFWFLKSYVDISKFFFDFRKHLSMHGIEKILAFSVGQHTSKNSGVKDTIMNKGVEAIKNLVNTVLNDLLPLILKVSILLVGLFILDWHLGLFIFSISVFVVFLQLRIAKKYIPEFQKLEKLGQERHKGFWEVLRNIFLIKNSGREEYGYKHIENLFDHVNIPSKKYWLGFSFRLHFSSVIIAVSSAAFMGLAVWKIGQGTLSPGMFIVVSTWAGMLFSELYMFQSIQRTFAFQIPAIQELKDFMDIQPAIKILKNTSIPEKFEGEIEFQNVSFKYPDDEGEDSVLENISFTIKPKETIGVVGRSGSGKSTLIKLLLRNYDPSQGNILIDGKNLKKLNLSWYLQHIGYVEQSTQLFDMTLRENLAFATSEQLSESDFERALKQAGLLDFIRKLPNGLDTKIGEQGIKLSGGQRQRLAIARALIKKPALLILDEATASLDTEKEREIQEAIDNLTHENISATKIVIAHRLSTVINADRIFVFDNGSLVESGTHRELLENCEIYQNLYNLQHESTNVL